MRKRSFVGVLVGLVLVFPCAVRAGFGGCNLENTSAFVAPGVHSFVVPENVHLMQAEVIGAAGGASGTPVPFAPTGGNGGGFGAAMAGEFAVTPGETLTVLVGGPGGDAAGPFCGGGGGGASAVARAGFVPLLVAGGGGGGGDFGSNASVSDASLLPAGKAGDGGGGAGGLGGNGGGASSGAGGGGVNLAGDNAVGGGTGGGALSLLAEGGVAAPGGGAGGFGGGGASGGTQGCAGGGGGGGYSGGGGGSGDDGASGSGGGGGTFDSVEVTFLFYGPNVSSATDGSVLLCWGVEPSILEVPTLDPVGVAVMALLLATVALLRWRRRTD